MRRDEYLESLIVRALRVLGDDGCIYHRTETAESILEKFDEWEEASGVECAVCGMTLPPISAGCLAPNCPLYRHNARTLAPEGLPAVSCSGLDDEPENPVKQKKQP